MAGFEKCECRDGEDPLELRRRCDSVKEGGFDDAAKKTGRP
jgi:hypothetical protein